ncbi:MAG: helix-turn-helix domain-containing protein [Planctomycetaceae bacterium]
MAKQISPAPFYDPRRGDDAIQLHPFEIAASTWEPSRTNCFSLCLIESGTGTIRVDSSQFTYAPRSLHCVVPYQHLRFTSTGLTQGNRILFHANFLCVETFHAEVGCSGTLFNDPYGSPVVNLGKSTHAEIRALFKQIQKEQTQKALAHQEVMLAFLKAILILAARQKGTAAPHNNPAPFQQHPLLHDLRELIEQHYTKLHTPAEYAKRLHVTAKSLGQIVRENLGTTLTDLIRSRILIHAKWQLLHTRKTVKEVAREVGFSDELYFSRLFKKATGLSPIYFREFETEIRGGSNLSMLSGHPSILRANLDSDN